MHISGGEFPVQEILCQRQLVAILVIFLLKYNIYTKYTYTCQNILQLIDFDTYVGNIR